jgi:hypothetical protein
MDRADLVMSCPMVFAMIVMKFLSSGAPMTMTDDATYLCCMGEGK